MDNCIFCKIINNEISSYRIFENENFLAFLDVNPIVEGHVVLISKRHVEKIYDLNDDEVLNLGKSIKEVSQKLSKKFGENISIINSSGEAASQTVGHFHVHLIPRNKSDRLWEGEFSKVVFDRSSGFERLIGQDEQLLKLVEELNNPTSILDIEPGKKESLKFVLAGHVDHGKSTLIGRLLYDTDSLPPDKIEEIKNFSENLGRDTEFAFLLDHLQEEREQGITIDTTQIFFSTPEKEFVIIDAPGHVEFVKNMITGASQAEAAVLIVDANEGVQEQTKRHANILALLGLNQVLVVFNKMDLVNYSQEVFEKIKKDTIDFLDSINIKPNFFIPISSLKGDNIVNKSSNMPWYFGGTLLASLKSFKSKDSLIEKSLLLGVQDVYKIDDKRINVGRVESGEIKEGLDICILPDKTFTKIKSVEVFNSDINTGKAGENIGFVTEDPIFIERGNVICEKGQEPLLTNKIEAKLFWMSKQPLNINELLVLKCNTQEVFIDKIEIKKRINSSSLEVLAENSQSLENLEVGEVVITTKRPIAIKKFSEVEELGRFVFMRDENICAGGIII